GEDGIRDKLVTGVQTCALPICVINFAQGQFGALGASIMAVLFVNNGWSFWAALPIALATGAVLGGLTELLVVRRLFTQPRLLLFVATIGVTQVILLLQLQLP